MRGVGFLWLVFVKVYLPLHFGQGYSPFGLDNWTKPDSDFIVKEEVKKCLAGRNRNLSTVLYSYSHVIGEISPKM